MATYLNAKDVARWFLMRNNINVLENDDELLTHLKIQKLLYYAQGLYLAYTHGKPLFDEDILAWEHGPVVRSVYDYFRRHGKNGIEYEEEDGDKEILETVSYNETLKDILESTYEVFGKYSAWRLREMTHEERPWKTANINDVIPKNVIQYYFEEEILVD